MKQELKVPRMGESISEATVGEIFKETGSYVKRDEEILELETDKVNQVIYAPAAGLLTLNVQREAVVRVDDLIGSIETDSKEAPKEASKEPEPKEAPKETPKKASKEPEPKPEPMEKPQPKPPSKAPAEVPSARTTKEDLIAELTAKTEKPPAISAPQERRAEDRRETRRKMTKIRKIIAQKLVEAQQATAMLTTFNEVDMTQIMALRAKHQETFQKQFQVKLGFMSFFVKACCSALEHYPDFNSYIEGDEIVTRNFYDIGVAVGTEEESSSP